MLCGERGGLEFKRSHLGYYHPRGLCSSLGVEAKRQSTHVKCRSFLLPLKVRSSCCIASAVKCVSQSLQIHSTTIKKWGGGVGERVWRGLLVLLCRLRGICCFVCERVYACVRASNYLHESSEARALHDDLGQVGSTNPRAHFAANKAAPGGWATACIGVIVLMRTNADKTKISGGGADTQRKCKGVQGVSSPDVLQCRLLWQHTR